MGAPKSPTESASRRVSRPAAPSGAAGTLVLQRDRLHALLDARLPGAVWLQGPTGAGKTVLLRTYLHRDGAPTVWMTVDERHRDPAALFAALGTAVASLATGHLPSFSPEHRDDPVAFAVEFFTRVDDALPGDGALVVDDVHHVAGSTAPLLAAAIDVFGGRRRLCFASQLLPDAAFAPQLAGSRLWIVGHRLLAFDEDEALALARRLGGDPASLRSLVDATDGWAAGLMLAMQLGAGQEPDDGSHDPLASVRTPLALLIAGQVLGGADNDEVARLRVLSELPQVPLELADIAPDWAGACARLGHLADRGLFVERLVAERPEPTSIVPVPPPRVSHGCWRLHDLFRDSMRASAPALDASLASALIDALLSARRLDLAWQIAARIGGDALSGLVEQHQQRALRDDALPSLLQLAKPHVHRAWPAVAIWQARALIGNDGRAALLACEEAHAGYEQQADAGGMALAVALAMFIVFGGIELTDEISVWVRRQERIDRLRPDDDLLPEARALRLAGEVVHDLLIGGRAADGDARSAMQDALFECVAAEVLSASETVLAGSVLVTAMRRAMRVSSIERVIVRVESLASFQRVAPHIRASWSIENGYNFARFGRPESCRIAFRDALTVADANALLQPRIAALIGLARLELGVGRTSEARGFLGQLATLEQQRLGSQRGWVVHLQARLESMTGHHAAALRRLDQASVLIRDAGFFGSSTVILDQDRIQILYASGQRMEALKLASDLIERTSGADRQRFEIVHGLLEVDAASSAPAEGDVTLSRWMDAAESIDLTTFLYLVPEVAARLSARALDAGIAKEFVTRTIRVRQLPAPPDAPASWPWPLRMEVLHPFRICRDGEPLTFAGKVQQKPLELLKYLSCTRELLADYASIEHALWPDAEEASARKSLEVTVSRLRKLLADDTLIIVCDGKVALDRTRASSDAIEFLQVASEAEAVADGLHRAPRVAELGQRLMRLFSELPLENEEPTAWRESVRERFRSHYLRAARTIVSYWTGAGESERAIDMIETVLSREPLAESLYRSLMQIHFDAGNGVEAMRVYRQCRQMLSVLIGAQPSPETEKLKNAIQTKGLS